MAKPITLILVLIGMFLNFSNAQDYCNIQSCKEKNEQTLCKYSSSQPASKCNNVIRSGLTADEKQKIVNLHNQLRQDVAKGNEKRGNPGPQPAARNMATLEWDDELEKVAQRWAIQCDFGHDSCRNVDRFGVGQNVAGGDANFFNVENFVNMWYNEVQNYNKNEISNYRFDTKTGHYTQLVWAKTTKIGCGGIIYKDTNSYTNFYLVCNYGPSGNFIGQPVYEVA